MSTNSNRGFFWNKGRNRNANQGVVFYTAPTAGPTQQQQQQAPPGPQPPPEPRPYVLQRQAAFGPSFRQPIVARADLGNQEPIHFSRSYL